MSEHEQEDHSGPAPQQGPAAEAHWASAAGTAEGAAAPETKDCVFWMRGECLKGDACPFRHDPAKLGTAPQQHGHGSAAAGTGTALPPCKYFLAGYCDKGDACPFPHIVCLLFLFFPLFFMCAWFHTSCDQTHTHRWGAHRCG